MPHRVDAANKIPLMETTCHCISSKRCLSLQCFLAHPAVIYFWAGLWNQNDLSVKKDVPVYMNGIYIHHVQTTHSVTFQVSFCVCVGLFPWIHYWVNLLKCPSVCECFLSKDTPIKDELTPPRSPVCSSFIKNVHRISQDAKLFCCVF